jgi:hypothetical protein
MIAGLHPGKDLKVLKENEKCGYQMKIIAETATTSTKE